MNTTFLICLLFFAAPAFRQADHQWILQQNSFTHHVSHPLHQSEGVSHEARGKDVCHQGHCDFLIAMPVKSFDSGDGNRDLHMVQVVQGAFTIVTVGTRLPEDVGFVGQGACRSGDSVRWTNRRVQAGAAATGERWRQFRITETVPATLSYFKIDPPSLLTFHVKNEIPGGSR